MRTIHTDEIIKNVKEMCIEANLRLSPDMEQALQRSLGLEQSELGKRILGHATRISNCSPGTIL